jgi:2-oxoglutarate ferredoxin oxidoreductase subunit beta
MPTSEDYKGQVPAWCPGCGNFQILSAIKQALVELGIEPWEVLVVSGIGQAGKLPHYIKCHTFTVVPIHPSSEYRFYNSIQYFNPA